MKAIFFILLITFYFQGYAQIEEKVTPLSKIYVTQIDSIIPEKEIYAYNNDSLDSLYNSSCPDSSLCPEILAIGESTQLTKDSFLVEEIDSYVIARIKIRSDSAHGFKIVADTFRMPGNAWLFIDPLDTSSAIYGGYGFINNRDSFNFVSHAVWSNEIILEINCPQSNWDSVRLELSHIYYYFKDRYDFGESLPCHVNVNCSPYETGWCNEIRAVGKLEKVLVPAIAGRDNLVGSATVTLVANYEDKNYFLGARHSFRPKLAGGIPYGVDYNSSQVYFNFQSSDCTNRNGNDRMVVTGLRHIAHDESGWPLDCPDMQLTEFEDEIPVQYNVFFAGWATSVPDKDDEVHSIHHPAGDIKKISRGTMHGNPLLTTCAKVKWDDGYQEGGSSGCGLFDENHLLTGTLSYNLRNEDQCHHDAAWYYGKLDKAWDKVGEYLADDEENTVAMSGWDPIMACQQNIEVMGNLWPAADWQDEEQIIIQAQNEIVAAPNGAITTVMGSWPGHPNLNNNSDYVFRAGNRVRLLPGFSVELGNRFRAETGPCLTGGDCGINHKREILPFDSDSFVYEYSGGKRIVKRKPDFSKEIPKQEPPKQIDEFSYSYFPNPAFSNVTFRYNIPYKGYLKIELQTLSGKHINSLFNNVITQGTYENQVNTGQLPNGVYFLKVMFDGNIYYEKIVKVSHQQKRD